MGTGPAGSSSQDTVFVLGGRLCLWIHEVPSSAGTKAALCLHTKLSRNHSPRQVPEAGMECDGARQGLDSPQPRAARACQSSSVWTKLSDTWQFFLLFCAGPGLGLDGPCGSLPTVNIL